MGLADEARQYIKQAFRAVEQLPHTPDQRSTQLLEDVLSAMASASWWLDDWQAAREDALSWVPGAGTACRGVDVSRPGK
jgi:hypothetical protein